MWGCVCEMSWKALYVILNTTLPLFGIFLYFPVKMRNMTSVKNCLFLHSRLSSRILLRLIKAGPCFVCNTLIMRAHQGRNSYSLIRAFCEVREIHWNKRRAVGVLSSISLCSHVHSTYAHKFSLHCYRSVDVIRPWGSVMENINHFLNVCSKLKGLADLINICILLAVWADKKS